MSSSVLPIYSINPLIQEIHNSDLFGSIIETGTNVPIAHELFSVSGSSKTMFMAESPYNKEYARDKYNIPESERAVSMNFTKLISNYYLNQYKSYNNSNPSNNSNISTRNRNFVLVSSFQVGDAANYGTITHGWICIAYKENIKYFHLTVRDFTLNRIKLNDLIGKIGIELIWYMLKNCEVALSNESFFSNNSVDIDIISDNDNKSCDHIALHLLSMKNFEKSNPHLLFAPNQGLIRLESILRNCNNTLLLYKGSFNPPTVKHLSLAEESKLAVIKEIAASNNKKDEIKENDEEAKSDSEFTAPIFAISMNTVDKGTVQRDHLQQRIQLLLSLNLYVLINIGGRFQQSIDFFHKTMNLPNLRLFFPVGADTYVRLEQSVLTQNNVKFIEFARTDVSSTQVRNILQELKQMKNKDDDKNKAIERLKLLVPEGILEKVLIQNV